MLSLLRGCRLSTLLRLAMGAAVLLALSGCVHVTGGVLDPKGLVAKEERTLMFDSVALMLIVVIPVIIMSFAFAFRYRARHGNKSRYRPNWCHNVALEAIWWGVPCIIIIALGIITWITSHRLDPYRPLDKGGKPMVIQAVSLQWKWLFIYPEQGIATVNQIDIPRGRQVEFQLTSVAPMSAFFIPQLSSQIYTMAGMRTRLHLYTDNEGTYRGLNAQYNGDGFSDMEFKVNVVAPEAFTQWVQMVKSSNSQLTLPIYQQLVKPTIAAPVTYYSSVMPGLFRRIMMSYMMPNMKMHG